MEISFVQTLVWAFFVFVSFLILATVIIYKVSFQHWKHRNVYTWIPTFPFGNAGDVFFQRKQFGFDIVELYNELKCKSLRYGGYYFFLTPVFVPVDLNLIKRIFVNDFDYFPDRIAHVNEENDPLSTNVLHATMDRWKIIRPILRSSVSSKNINTSFPILRQHIDVLLDLVEKNIKEQDSLDIKEILDSFNIDILGSFFLKYNCNTMVSENKQFKNKMTNFFNNSIKDNIIRLFISSPSIVKFCKIKTFSSEVTQFFTKFVDDMMKSRDDRNNVPNDVLSALMFNSVPLTKNEIIANIAALFLGGYDTTSNSTSFCLYELAFNKELQDQLRSEIRTVFQNNSDRFDDLVFLDKCVKETLRKYPMGAVVTRICRRNYFVPDSNLVLSKGTHIYIPTRAVHWDPEFYPNPEVFNPERFSEGVQKRSCSWMPFGVGPRHCFGYKLGIASMKLSIIMLLQNYEFSLHPSTKYPAEYDPKTFILQSKTPIRLIAKKIA